MHAGKSVGVAPSAPPKTPPLWTSTLPSDPHASHETQPSPTVVPSTMPVPSVPPPLPPPELERILTYDPFEDRRPPIPGCSATTCSSVVSGFNEWHDCATRCEGDGHGVAISGTSACIYDGDFNSVPALDSRFAACSDSDSSFVANVEPAYVTTRDHQFQDDGLTVRVRRTFLDLCPVVLPLARAHTEPWRGEVEAKEEADLFQEASENVEIFADASDPSEQRRSDGEEAEEFDEVYCEVETLLSAPPPLPLEKFQTPEWFPSSAWGRKEVPAASIAAFGFTAENPEDEGEPEAEFNKDDSSSSFPPPPAPLPFEHFPTPDYFDNPQESNSGNGPQCMWAKTRTGDRIHAVVAPTLSSPLRPTASADAATSSSTQIIPPLPPPCYPAPAASRSVKKEPPPPPVGDAADEPLRFEGAPLSSGLACVESPRGRQRVFWAVDARKLDSQDKQAVSPDFSLDLADDGPQPFRLVIKPTPKNDGRRGAGFKKSKGKGRVELKCEVQRESGASDLTFRVSVGRGDSKQGVRGPVSYNFADGGSCCGLGKGKDEWDFRAAIDETRCFLICLETIPPGTSCGEPCA
eukprot:TRINITY_DN63414_c0_g1_i1.p1 TRINITY_DN63414_c0_g1~~TRINITY_DN63414_c0_g1_i1.p1  ORF type:complete len:578 (+),score=100.69 TRINITY_DN63414_c0_g1_i1:234-1967(+)